MLLIHTCGAAGSVAVADEAGVRAEVGLGIRAASEELMPGVRRTLKEAGWGAGELAAVGVVRGPGSFTGVRTGWSVGKGLCEARGIPLVGVSRLALVAARVGLVNAVLDAGRGSFTAGGIGMGFVSGRLWWGSRNCGASCGVGDAWWGVRRR